jgi:pyrroline-5-carboxylate reductase
MEKQTNIAIIGAGNLGMAIIKGLLASDIKDNISIVATKRKLPDKQTITANNLTFTQDNASAVKSSDVVIFSVQPDQFTHIVEEVRPLLPGKVIISTITGLTIKALEKALGADTAIVRSMPNTAIAVSQSMTCLSYNGNDQSIATAQKIFNTLGKTLIIEDSLMQAATVLGASGIAFWMRLIRATTQGGIQLGFDADEAKAIAVQTCLGAASILAHNHGSHPESEIDKVTTPKGCTIRGLNEMEYRGLSSALIRGLTASYEMISQIKENMD